MMAGDGPHLMLKKTIMGNSVRYFLFIIFSDFAENYELVAHEIVALDGRLNIFLDF